MAGPGIIAEDLKILKELAFVTSLRGTDSSGIIQCKTTDWHDKKGHKYTLEKSSSDMSYFIWYHTRNRDGNRKVFEGINNNFFAVHCRHATKGDINDANSHPFDFEQLVGMHNGTLKDTRYQHNEKTDSELLLKDMDDRGIIPVLEDLEEEDNALALVIWNKINQEVHFIRNKHRELHFCQHETRGVIYWASEPWMLRGILGRNNVKLLGNSTYYLKPNRVYTFKPTSVTYGKALNFDTVDFTPKKKELTVVSRRSYPAQQSLLDWPKTPARILPEIKCAGCTKPMSLLDRHEGLPVGGGTFVCKSCKNEYSDLLLMPNTTTKGNILQ